MGCGGGAATGFGFGSRSENFWNPFAPAPPIVKTIARLNRFSEKLSFLPWYSPIPKIKERATPANTVAVVCILPDEELPLSSSKNPDMAYYPQGNVSK